MTTGRKSATKSWDNSRPFCVKFSLVLRSIQLTKTKCSLGKIPFNFNCQKTTSDEKICGMYFSDCALYYGEKSRRLKLRTEEQGPPVRRNTWGGRVVVVVDVVVVGRGGGASFSDIGWNLPPCWWKVEMATKPCLGVWWSLKPEPRGQSWLAFPRPRQNQSLWLSYGAMISRIKVFKNVIEKFQQVSSNNSIVIIFFLMAISWHLWQLFRATIRIFWSFRPWQKFLAMIGCQW